MVDDPEFPIVHRVERDDMSSSTIVVRATGPIDEHGLEITLDPMTHPVEKIDVYPNEVYDFFKAVNAVISEAREDDDGA